MHPLGDHFAHVRLQIGLDPVEIRAGDDVPIFGHEQVAQYSIVLQQDGIGVGAALKVHLSFAAEQVHFRLCTRLGSALEQATRNVGNDDADAGKI